MQSLAHTISVHRQKSASPFTMSVTSTTLAAVYCVTKAVKWMLTLYIFMHRCCMARLHSTLSTVAHRSPMLLAGSISGRPHSKWWWCHDISYPLLAAEHSLCKAPWSGTPCRTTSVHSRTMSPLDSAWKPGFSLATSVLSTLETSWQLRCINSHLPYHAIHIYIGVTSK